MRWGCKQGKTLSAKQSFGKKVLKTHARNHAIKLYVRGCENDTTGSVILRHLAVVGRDVKRRRHYLCPLNECIGVMLVATYANRTTYYPRFAVAVSTLRDGKQMLVYFAVKFTINGTLLGCANRIICSSSVMVARQSPKLLVKVQVLAGSPTRCSSVW